MFERVQRTRAGAPVVSGDQHDVGEGLRDPGRDRADARLAHQLHVHSGIRIRTLQVEDELLQVFDRVDVVVGWWTDQTDARGRMTGLRNPRVHLVRRQLSALAGLRPLRHLDLDVGRMRQVHARHAEAAGGDLLDRAATFGVEQTRGVFASLPRVALGPESVHGNCEVLVRLRADRAVAHGAGREAADDGCDGLHLVDGHRGPHPRAQRQQATQRHEVLGLLVDEARVVAEDVVAAGLGRVLQLEDRFGIEEMRRPVAPPLVLAAGCETLMSGGRAIVGVGVVMTGRAFGRDDLDADAAEESRGAGEVLVDELLAEPDRFEGLRAGVGADDADAHLRHDLEHALTERFVQVADGLLRCHRRDHPAAHQLFDALHGEVGVDRRRSVADQESDVVHFAHVAGFDDDADLHAIAFANEVVVHRREHEQRRNRGQVGVGVAVGEHDEHRAVIDRGIDFEAHLDQAFLHGLRSVVDPVQTADRRGRRAARPRIDVLDLRELVVVDHRKIEDDLACVLGSRVEQVALGSEAYRQRGDDLFADRIERRVGDLSEGLGEVVEQQPGALRQNGDGSVRPHSSQWLHTIARHRHEQNAHLLFGVPEGALTACDGCRSVHDVFALGEICEVDPPLVEPLAPRHRRRELTLDLVVFDESTCRGVDQKHLARAQSSLSHHAFGCDVEYADLARQYDEPVVGDEVPTGAQPVAIERRTDQIAVGEDERGGAVPRFHDHRVVLVEVASVGVDIDLVLVRLGHHHHHRVWQRPAGQIQEFDDLIERRGVARPSRVDREDRIEIAEQLRLQLRFARVHPVAVAPDRVYLAVVCDHPEGLRERP